MTFYDPFSILLQTGDRSHITTGPEETITSDILVFAAEKARRENRVINPQTETLTGYFKWSTDGDAVRIFKVINQAKQGNQV